MIDLPELVHFPGLGRRAASKGRHAAGRANGSCSDLPDSELKGQAARAYDKFILLYSP